MYAQLVKLEKQLTDLTNARHAQGWDTADANLIAAWDAVLQAKVAVACAIDAAQSAYLATLPPVPAGYYLALCKDGENGCPGWHIYKYGAWQPDLEGYVPTGEFYCNGGDGQQTGDWVHGRLQPFDSLESEG